MDEYTHKAMVQTIERLDGRVIKLKTLLNEAVELLKDVKVNPLLFAMDHEVAKKKQETLTTFLRKMGGE